MPLLNDEHKPLYIQPNWFTVESLGIKSDCDGVIILFAYRKLHISGKTSNSNTLPAWPSSEVGG